MTIFFHASHVPYTKNPILHHLFAFTVTSLSYSRTTDVLIYSQSSVSLIFLIMMMDACNE
jgi:hypothetical protein